MAPVVASTGVRATTGSSAAAAADPDAVSSKAGGSASLTTNGSRMSWSGFAMVLDFLSKNLLCESSFAICESKFAIREA